MSTFLYADANSTDALSNPPSFSSLGISGTTTLPASVLSPSTSAPILDTGELGSTLGSAASSIPIAGIALSIVTSLLQGHAIRAKDAASEDAAMNQIIPGITQAFQQIAVNVNNGSYTPAQAESALANLLASYNSFVQSLQGKPGIADNHNAPGSVCGKACTIGCCLRGAYVQQTINQFVAALQNGTGVVGTSGIPASKYGFTGVPAWQVTVKPGIPVVSSLAALIGVLPGQGILSSPKVLIGLGILLLGGIYVIVHEA